MPISDTIADNMPAMRRYARHLTRNPETADDLVQDTVLKLLNRPDGAEAATNPQAYLMRSLRNQFIDLGRRARMAPLAIEDVEIAAREDQAETMTARQVSAAIDDLPPDLADILRRVGENRDSYAEIAGALGVPIGTVMSRVSRARAALRERLCGSATGDCF